MEPVTCQTVIEEVSTTLRTLAESKGLHLEILLPDHEVNVRTDRRSLTQILINLTNNAIKFTERGTVRLELHEREEDGQSTAEICVADTGLGIRQEDQPKLFQAFMQVDSSSTRAYEGTGLGLHVSQKLAAMVGGRISFESEYGQGSQFTVSLPLTQSFMAVRKAQAGH
jgi:signal transduction histidine kinase